jgi:hypothetical protein
MNRLHASLAAAALVTTFFATSVARANEGPAVEAAAPAAVVTPEENVGEVEAKAEVASTSTPEEPVASSPAVEMPSATVFASSAPVVTPSLVAPSLGTPVDTDAKVEGDRRDKVRVGALVGVGFPRPLAVEGFVKINRRVGIGAEYSFLPRANLFGADTSFKAAAADLRIFPFKNGFFVGLRGGRQWLDATATASFAGQSATESMSASTWFVNPRLGFLHTFESGITIGLDAGVQVPIAPEYTRVASPAIAGAENDASEMLRTAANVLGNKTTPTVDLLRVGFVF